MEQTRKPPHRRPLVVLAALGALALAIGGCMSPGDIALTANASDTPSVGNAAPASPPVAAPDVCAWSDLYWSQMPAAAQQAWAALGWTEETWDSDDGAQVASDSKAWAELAEDEKAAARALGYTQKNWDVDSCKRR